MLIADLVCSWMLGVEVAVAFVVTATTVSESLTLSVRQLLSSFLVGH